MLVNFYEAFLEDEALYDLSVQFWKDLWVEVLATAWADEEWYTPWVGTGGPEIRDGNPIFSAYSPTLKRAVRIVQEEPYKPGLDFQFWLDNTGNPFTDPNSISELVIACVLSDAAAAEARNLLPDWLRGEPLEFKARDRRLVQSYQSSSRSHANRVVYSAV